MLLKDLKCVLLKRVINNTLYSLLTLPGMLRKRYSPSEEIGRTSSRRRDDSCRQASRAYNSSLMRTLPFEVGSVPPSTPVRSGTVGAASRSPVAVSRHSGCTGAADTGCSYTTALDFHHSAAVLHIPTAAEQVGTHHANTQPSGSPCLQGERREIVRLFQAFV